MEMELRDGDYVPDGTGGLRRLGGSEAALQRALFRLKARRGQFPFWETLGSSLWKLGRLPVREHQAAARQYVAEALAEETGLRVETVELTHGADGRGALRVELTYGGERLTAALTLGE